MPPVTESRIRRGPELPGPTPRVPSLSPPARPRPSGRCAEKTESSPPLSRRLRRLARCLTTTTAPKDSTDRSRLSAPKVETRPRPGAGPSSTRSRRRRPSGGTAPRTPTPHEAPGPFDPHGSRRRRGAVRGLCEDSLRQRF